MNVNWIGPYNPLGYGVASSNIMKALDSIGYNVAYFPIGQPQVEARDTNIVQKFLKQAQFYNSSAPSLRMWHQHDLAQHVGLGPHIGFPIFELDNFNDVEKYQICQQDIIFVCSHWAKTIVETTTKHKEVYVVPLGVDRSIFHENLGIESSHDKTVFINISKWELRKGHDVLVEAFNKAFEPTDNVLLYLMTHNPFLSDKQSQEWIQLYKSSKMGDKIHLIGYKATHQEVANVMASCDCGVFPSRAEGWNLEALEMMSMGKTVIVTDYSAHTEFCNADNSLLIDMTDVEPAHDGIWFHGQGNWMEFGDAQMDMLVGHMHDVYRRKYKLLLDVNNAGIETAKGFSWENSARKIEEVFKYVGTPV